MDLFDFTDYKQYLQAVIQLNGEVYGYKSKLADAARCQRSYISQVLGGNLQLTSEQAAGLCKFWNFEIQKTDYFINLVNHARSGTNELKQFYEDKLEKIRQAARSFSNPFRSEELSSEQSAAIYYSTWLYGAVRLSLTLPDCDTPDKIALRLKADPSLVAQILSTLKGLNLAYDNEQGQWQATRKSVHLPKESALTVLNHSNWRHKAIESAAKRNPDNIHYSAALTMAKKDAERIRSMLYQSIERAREIVISSPEEEIYCMTCDFFNL